MAEQTQETQTSLSPSCPHCGGAKPWRDGTRKSVFGDTIQRWLCRNCGLRFSDPEDVKNGWGSLEKITRNIEELLKTQSDIAYSRQICVEETKNLATEQETHQVPCRKELDQDQKGAIVDFLWQLKRQNYSEDTITCYGFNLTSLIHMGINLFDPQTFIDKMTELGDAKTNTRKYNLAKALKSFLNYHQIEAKLPKYKFKRPLPYVPPEEYLDQLIACALSDQMSVLLWTLKELGARPGEVLRLEWNDIDIAHKTINISHPEKGCNSRILPISEELLKVLLALPHIKQNFIFNYKNRNCAGRNFRKLRDRAIRKFGNLELRKIDFYTFRYWRATEEYDRSHKDFESVMYLLGHTSLKYAALQTT